MSYDFHRPSRQEFKNNQEWIQFRPRLKFTCNFLYFDCWSKTIMPNTQFSYFRQEVCFYIFYTWFRLRRRYMYVQLMFVLFSNVYVYKLPSLHTACSYMFSQKYLRVKHSSTYEWNSGFIWPFLYKSFILKMNQ